MAFGDVLKAKTTNTGGFGSILGEKTTTTGGFGSVFGGTQSQDLGTSQGLYNTAVQSGLQPQADTILATKGEQPKNIFSGGFISDIFDTLNTVDYGVVGMLKGKSFSEGVKTRQSFTDQDALGSEGLSGAIMGTILDIAVDPLTYIAPWTVLKKVPGLTKLAKVASKVTEESKIGKWFGEKFIYMFGKDPIYREGWERAVKNIQVGNQNISKMVNGIIDLPQEKVGLLLSKDETGRFIRTPLEQLQGKLTDDELFNVSKTYSVLDDMGKQATELGLLKKETWEENMGEYVKNAYK